MMMTKLGNYIKKRLSRKAKPEAVVKQNRMSREYINSLPIIKFDGNISVIKDVDSAEYAIDYLKSEKIIGFDTESRPSFKKGISYPISLIQFSTEDRAFLFQIDKTGFFKSLKELLEDEKTIKVGIGIDADRKKLKELDEGLRTRGWVDLKKIAEKKGIVQSGARALTARYLEHRITKGAQRSNWAASSLSPKQIKYAATDAWICFKIYPLIQKDNYQYIDELKVEQEKAKKEKAETK